MCESRKFLALMKKDAIGVRRSALLVLVVLILPVAFGFMFGTFKNILPRGTPSAIVAESENVSEKDMRFAFTILDYFSEPKAERVVDESKLFREETYFILVVPPGLLDKQSTVRVVVDSSMTPVADLTPVVVGSIRDALHSAGYYNIEIEVEKKGRSILPFEFFVPGVLLMLSAGVGLLLTPFFTARDKNVFPRLMGAVSTPVYIADKMVFALLLIGIQAALLLLTQLYFGSAGESLFKLNEWSALTLAITTIYFASFGLSIMLITRFSEAGKQINAFLFGAVAVFSGAFYPVGFFPLIPGLGNILQTISKSLPTYYSTVLLRSFGARGLGIGLFEDYFAVISISAVAGIVLLHYSIERLKK